MQHCSDHIAGRPVAAHQIIIGAVGRGGAAYLLRRRPDDLGVVTNVRPVASAADSRKASGAIVAPLADQMTDHLSVTVSAAGPHPQVFALSRVAAALRVMFEPVGPGEDLGIGASVARQPLVPN